MKSDEDTLAGVPLVPKQFPTKTIRYRNRQLRLYSLKWLAAMSRRNPQTFYRLEKEGSMPGPIFDLKDGVRWYTAAEIKGYSKLFRAANLKAGRVHEGVKKPSLWFKTNAYAFKAKLKTFIEDHTDKVPETLPDEDKLLESLSRKDRLTFSTEEIELMIDGGIRPPSISRARTAIESKQPND